MPQQNTSSLKLYIIGAFGVVYLVWGSTYLANFWAIDSIPPFLMTSLRFLTAGIILYLVGILQGQAAPTWEEWKNALWLGFLFMGWGVGAVVWSEQFIDTGMVALMISIEPLIILFMMWGILGIKPGRLSWIGVFLGIVGSMILIGQPQFVASKNAILGVIAVMLAISGWGYASIMLSRVKLPESKLRASAIQMLCGGATLLPVSLFMENWSAFSLESVTMKSGMSWLYLVSFGSILAFSCFNFLLQHVSPEKVATVTYVHPIVAMLLGWGLNSEIITMQSIGAGGLLLAGVFLINWK